MFQRQKRAEAGKDDGRQSSSVRGPDGLMRRDPPRAKSRNGCKGGSQGIRKERRAHRCKKGPSDDQEREDKNVKTQEEIVRNREREKSTKKVIH